MLHFCNVRYCNRGCKITTNISYLKISINKIAYLLTLLNGDLEHEAPLIISRFVLELFAPYAIAHIKKAKFEMTMFGEYKCRKVQLSFG